MRVCIQLEPEPLIEKLELIPGLSVCFINKALFLDELPCIFMVAELVGPQLPGSASKLDFESDEVCVGLQPFLVRFLEFRKRIVFVRRSVTNKRSIGFVENRPAQLPLAPVVDVTARKGSKRIKIMGFEKPVLEQCFEINEIRITGECREALVWRVSESSRAQRADLPILQFCGDEKIDEPPRFMPKGANAGCPW